MPIISQFVEVIYLKHLLDASIISDLLCGFGVITEVLYTSHGWGASVRAHVRTPISINASSAITR